MEWMIPVNDMLKDDITKLNYTLVPPGDVRSVRVVQESLGKLIDNLGKQSASAQGLSKALTTAEKLRNAPSHVLYLLKDPAGKNGDGETIGFLKVAFKHLYLFDERDKVRQVEPLCVLDFYVSSAWERRGNGKRLFDYMLQDTRSRPQDLAIDRPSAKMEKFLAKHYGVGNLMRQNNNFAVSPAFFVTSNENNSGRSTPVVPAAAVGRFAARKPPSSISDIIHGTSDRVYVETTNRTPEEAPAAPPKRPTPEPVSVPEPKPEPVVPVAPAAPTPPGSPSPERPTTLPVAPAISVARLPAGSTTPRRDSQLTDQGYFDVKFYHNKLW